MAGFSASAVLAVLFGGLRRRRRGTLGRGHDLIPTAAVIDAMASSTCTIASLSRPAH